MNIEGCKPVELTKLLYSVAETAALLSYSRTVIYDLVKDKRLQAISPLGERGLKIPAQEIIRFIDTELKIARWQAGGLS
jgi:excisionase family DNA binding protein